MANSIKGERANCPCHREGWITERSETLEVIRPWWDISHEHGLTHRVEVRREGGFGRFVQVVEGPGLRD